MKPSEIIRKGKVQFFDRGWNQGELLGRKDGTVCALGAIAIAAVGEAGLKRDGYGVFDDRGPLRSAAHLLRDALADEERQGTDELDDVITFNDGCDSLNEVLDLFDRAEKIAEEREAADA